MIEQWTALARLIHAINLNDMDSKFINKESEELMLVMSALSSQSHQLAVIHDTACNGKQEMEESPDYMLVQECITNAIYQLGSIVGRNIAETFL